MLADKMQHHAADAWLINTGWNGGAYGVGKRISLKYSRAIIDAIHSGALAKVEYETYDKFGLQIPKTCPGVPSDILNVIFYNFISSLLKPGLVLKLLTVPL